MYISTYTQDKLINIVADYVDTFRRELFTDIVNSEFNINVDELDALTHGDTIEYFVERLDSVQKAEVYAKVADGFYNEIIHMLESGLVDKRINQSDN